MERLHDRMHDDGAMFSGAGVRRSERPSQDAPPPPERLTAEALTFVAEAGAHCQIFRDTAGGYVVEHFQASRATGAVGPGAARFQRVATLPCAYSLCLELEQLSWQG